MAGLPFIALLLGYWYYVGHQLFIYSYEDQGFDWLNPHIWKGLFSYRCGWLVYSPVMIFSLLGFFFLKRRAPEVFWSALVFTVLYIYIAFAWSIWWYGGSLGHRAMVQSYPILAFPLAAFVSFVMKGHWGRYAFLLLGTVFIYLNLWWTHQAHHGGMFQSEQMTGAYFWKVLGRFEQNENNLKLLDTDEEFNGIRKEVKMLAVNNFEGDTTQYQCSIPAIDGKHSFCLNQAAPYSPALYASLQPGDAQWVRATATVKCNAKEWSYWLMPQLIVKFSSGGKVVKERFIRVSRLIDAGETKTVFIDVSCPKKPFDNVEAFFWNGNSPMELAVDNLVLEKYNE